MASGSDNDAVERALARDLDSLGDAVAEDAFAGELYRGLAGQALVRADGSGDRVVLSWRRAERLVNDLRDRIGASSLSLNQTGGESAATERVQRALHERGWTARPVDTSTHDVDHQSEPTPPGRRDEGAEHAPSEPPPEWREAHREADERRP